MAASSRRTSATRGSRSSTPSRKRSPSGGAQVPVDIIHLKIADQSLWGRMREIVGLIDQARFAEVSTSRRMSIPTRGVITTWSASSRRGHTRGAEHIWSLGSKIGRCATA